jgi:molybdate transport system ATP-binding protein
VSPALEVRLDLGRRPWRLQLDAHCERFPLVVLGPSGAGKTSLLECIAGHERPQAGRLVWQGETLFDRARQIDVAPEARRLGYVMQDGALFPHLSVRDNVLFGVRSRRQQATALALLDELGIAHLGRQRPQSISGGERTRVALARAMASEPSLLLLDEPFVGLDPATRQSTQERLRQVLQHRGLPAILVTHERADAVAMGRWTWVLLQGRLSQAGSPQEILRRPASQAVARFVGTENFLPGQVMSHDAGLCQVRCGDVLVSVHGEAPAGTAVVVCVRPEDILVSTGGNPASSARNVLQATIAGIRDEGPLRCIDMQGALAFRALITPRAEEELSLRPGRAVFASFKAAAAHLLPAADFVAENR